MRLSFAAPLALSAALSTAGCDSKGQEAAAPPPRVVLVATVHAAPDALERSLSGTIRARVESDLGFRVGGKVVRRLVDAGAHVVPGQPLAELDPVDLELQLQQARAELAAATTARDMTQNELEAHRHAAQRRLVDRQRPRSPEGGGGGSGHPAGSRDARGDAGRAGARLRHAARRCGRRGHCDDVRSGAGDGGRPDRVPRRPAR